MKSTQQRKHADVNSVGKLLVKKKILMLWSKKIDTIDNTGIFDPCKDIYLIERRPCREDGPRYTFNKWFKSSLWCKKGRCFCKTESAMKELVKSFEFWHFQACRTSSYTQKGFDCKAWIESCE